MLWWGEGNLYKPFSITTPPNYLRGYVLLLNSSSEESLRFRDVFLFFPCGGVLFLSCVFSPRFLVFVSPLTGRMLHLGAPMHLISHTSDLSCCMLSRVDFRFLWIELVGEPVQHDNPILRGTIVRAPVRSYTLGFVCVVAPSSSSSSSTREDR